MVVFAAGSIACGLSTGLGSLVAARILQGMGGAMMTPVGRLIVLRTIPRSDMINAIAWLTVPALVRAGARAAARRLHHDLLQLALDLLDQHSGGGAWPRAYHALHPGCAGEDVVELRPQRLPADRAGAVAVLDRRDADGPRPSQPRGGYRHHAVGRGASCRLWLACFSQSRADHRPAAAFDPDLPGGRRRRLPVSHRPRCRAVPAGRCSFNRASA